MKTPKWLAGCLALALGSVIMVADLSYAQPQERGAWCPNAASQGGGPGRGPGNVNCPNYPGYQQRQARRGNRQGRGPQGPRSGQGGQIAPGATVPDSTQ
jgi:hypothetical protein